MTTNRIVLRASADRDIDDAVTYYIGEGSSQAAVGFIDALEKVFACIGRRPAIGSSRYAHELQLPNLRSWPLTRYPYSIFCIERADHVDVWRVLDARRDLPVSLNESAD